MSNQLYIITVQGLDRPGLVAGISEILADANINIVDIDQTVIRKLFAMFIISDFTNSTQTVNKIKEKLIKKGRELKVKISVEPYILDEGLRRKEERKLILLTIIGKDRPGIVAKFSNICAENGVNIERAKMMARGDTIAMELLLNTENLSIDFNNLKNLLHEVSLGLGLSAIIQRQDVFRKAKKLVVCDLDSTFIQQEIIDEISAIAGVGKKVKSITRRAMEGEIDYTKALKERVGLLKGLEVSILDEILNNISFSSGVEDLLLILKELGCKIAIITGSFSYFTDKIKEKFDIDYVFANELIIENGKLTGEVKEPIIDAEMKRKSIQKLIEKEGIKREEVIAIGDGANDRFMLMEAGLGIAFDAKAILRKIADGVIKKDNLSGLIYCLSEFKDY
ncbi:MAG: phosphoserine phosphatase SerB [Candidatus Methylarchaceae archaeon HK02M2]|nr:phosphoserine phosphatase SerB [Candidatus Methylarchaceae archaeon HK02M2]